MTDPSNPYEAELAAEGLTQEDVTRALRMVMACGELLGYLEYAAEHWPENDELDWCMATYHTASVITDEEDIIAERYSQIVVDAIKAIRANRDAQFAAVHEGAEKFLKEIADGES